MSAATSDLIIPENDPVPPSKVGSDEDLALRMDGSSLKSPDHEGPVLEVIAETCTEVEITQGVVDPEPMESLDVQLQESSATESGTIDSIQVEDATVMQVEVEEVTETGPYYWPFDWTDGFKPVVFSENAKEEFLDSNFLKGCKWAPDGSCLLTNSDDSKLRIFNFPANVSSIEDWNTISEGFTDIDRTWTSALSVKEGGTIYDFCWYPHATTADPATSCFLSTSKDTPIHLWDALYGNLRATYLAYNYADEPIAAYSVAFDPTGEYIYCGYEKCIRIFNTNLPGRNCSVIYLNKSPLPDLRLHGIISCIAFNSAWNNVYACGTYRRHIGLYMEDGTMICNLEKHTGGVTSLVFSRDGTKLYSGARADSKLICWDLRNTGSEYSVYDRAVDTQQRISFELTTDDRHLISGGTDGIVRVWDTILGGTEPYRLIGADTCINGVSLNPYVPVLATTSGKRHVPPVNEEGSSDNEDEIFDFTPPARNSSVRLWKV